MRTFTFRTGKPGTIAAHVREFMLALLLAARIINRNCTRSAKIASWIDLQEDFFKADFFSEDTPHNEDNFSFSLSDGVLTVTTKTEIAEGITACIDEVQGPEKDWHAVLIWLYVYGTALSAEDPDNERDNNR